MLLAVFFIIFFLLFIIIFLLNIYLEVIIERRRNKDFILLKVWLLRGLLNFRFRIDYMDLKEELGKLVVQYAGSQSGPAEEIRIPEAREVTLTGKSFKKFLDQVRAMARISTSWEALEVLIKGLLKAGIRAAQLPITRAALSRMLMEVFPRIKTSCLRLRWVTELGVGDPAITAVVTGALYGVKGTVVSLLNRRIDFRQAPEIEITPRFTDGVFNTRFEGIFAVNIGQIIKSFLWIFEDDLKRRLEKRWMSIPLKH